MNKASGRQSEWQSFLAPLAVCAYVLTYAMGIDFDLGLLLLAALGGLAAALTRHPPGGAGSQLHLAVYVFIAAQILSTLTSANSQRSLLLGLAVLPGLAIFFLLADYFSEQEMLRWLFVAHSLFALGAGISLLATLQRMGWAVSPGYVNWIAAMGSPVFIVPNDAIYLALLAPFAVAVILLRGPVVQKLIAGSSLMITVTLAGLMQSRLLAGMLLIMLMLLVAFLLRPGRALVAGVAVAGVILLLDAVRGFPLLERFAELWHSGNGSLWDARIPIWETAWELFLQHPLLGQGVHTFSYVSADGIQVNWAHNIYLEALAEQGIIGLGALLFLLGATCWLAWGKFRQSEGDTRIMAAAVLTVVAGLLFSGIFEISFVREWANEIVFFAVGATAFLQRRR
jgi:O-antigen ligase